MFFNSRSPIVFECEAKPVADVIADRSGNRDAAGRGDSLEARRHIHTVPEYVLAVDDHIAQIDPHAKLDAAVLRHVLVAPRHGPLDLRRAGNRVHDARKLHQHAVAGNFDNAAMVLCDLTVDEFPAVRLQRSQRAHLIQAHQTAETNHVGGEDRGKTAFHREAARFCELPGNVASFQAKVIKTKPEICSAFDLQVVLGGVPVRR